MKSPIDWGSWASLSVVGAACLAVAWRVSSVSVVEPELVPLEPPAAAAPVAASAPGDAGTPRLTVGYRLNAPEQTMVLSDALNEISDLALGADGESLWVVHDEKGTVFRISTKDGAVLQQIDFQKKKGDFEGVALVDGKVIAGRSDGVLFVIDIATGQATHFSVPVGVACNLEGLAWDPKTSRMLLACKGPIGAKSKRAWPVYALNLATQQMQKEPLFLVTRKAIDDYLAQHPGQAGLTENMASGFDPSGIAIHPQTGQIFMISTRSRALAVFDSSGALLSLEALDRSVHPQPEGIAFAADGTLFISSEARGNKARLLRFPPDARPEH